MDVVASWTGERADALRRALRMTNESFAEHLGVAVRTVAYWRDRVDIVPRPAMQEILDTALVRAPESARAQFYLILSEHGQEQGINAATTASPRSMPQASPHGSRPVTPPMTRSSGSNRPRPA
jgi:transcriptional regulator with XRE-family HTH domain